MKILFRQGIISKPELPSMLYETGGAVHIRASMPIILAFAHGKRDYIYKITQDVSPAWILPEGESDVWLYWEIDQVTGQLKYGTTTTTNPLHYDWTLPTSPVRGQYFFDLSDTKLKVWSGGRWIERIRLFAAQWKDGKLNELGMYSQANVVGPRQAGSIIFDRDNRPVYSFDDDTDRTKYFSTDETSIDNTFSNSHKVVLNTLQLNEFAGEALGKNKCIQIGDDGLVYLASRDEEKPVMGITDKAYTTGEKVSIINHGFVENRADWSWASPENTNLFVDTVGGLTTNLINDVSSQVIASVVSPNTILLNIQEKITLLTDVAPALTVTPTMTPNPTATPTITPTPSPLPVPFITTWTTSGPSETITLPLRSGYTYNMLVDWGDGNQDTITAWDQADKTHEYASSGAHTVTISGTMGAFYFNNSGDVTKLTDITQWGSVNFVSLESAFHGCTSLVVSATDAPYFGSVASMSAMFADCAAVDPYVSNWDVGSVTDMSGMFTGATSATPDVSNWDVSNVVDMSGMFENTTITALAASQWDVGSVVDMSFMFKSVVGLDPVISDWNVISVTDMQGMFDGATIADPDISTWDVSNVTTMEDMFLNGSFSEENYEKVLIEWPKLPLQGSVIAHFNGATYNGPIPANGKTDLVDIRGWVITDGGLIPTPTPTVTVTTTVTPTITPNTTITPTATMTPTVTPTNTVTPTVTPTNTVTPTPTPSGVSASTLKNDLIAWWDMEDASNGTRLDSHTNGYDLSDRLSNITQVAGVNGFAARCGGDASGLALGETVYGNFPLLHKADSDFSIALFVNLHTSSGGVNVVIGDGFLGGYTLKVTGTDFSWSVGNPTTFQSITGSVGTWYHLYCFHDSVNDLIGYRVDGAAAVSVAHTNGIQSGATVPLPFGVLGNYLQNACSPCIVDSVAAWDRLLTNSEVLEHYNSGSGMSYPT